MTVTKPARMLGAAAVLMAVPLAAAMAQTQPPSPSQTSPPEIVRSPATSPEQSSAKSNAYSSLAGLAVMSSDGHKLGTVQSTGTGPDGKVKILLKTGGFLGFGGHVVAIPEGKFTRNGEALQLSMTAEEVSKLPEAKN
jgi:hypothetical protein